MRIEPSSHNVKGAIRVVSSDAMEFIVHHAPSDGPAGYTLDKPGPEERPFGRSQTPKSGVCASPPLAPLWSTAVEIDLTSAGAYTFGQ
jgi:hypothetical protein